MKIRWREHEAVLMNITAAILICKYVFDAAQMSGPVTMILINTLIPRIATVILVWLCYFWVNRIILPELFAEKLRTWEITLAILQVFIIAYILGPLVNFASYYIKSPSNPDELSFPSSFDYHPQPLFNTFGGLGIILFLLFNYLLYAIIREQLIRRLQKSDAFKIAVLNEITLFILRLLALPIFTGIFNLITEPMYYNIYFACLLPTQAVFLTDKFYLFPLKGDRSFYSWQTAGPLAFFSFLYTIVFSPALGEHWSLLNVGLIWALELFFVVPISWLDYKQEADKILRLRGLEKALVTSKADLQLLRMQINPHFLFNILNTIYGTALMEGALRTAESTQKLGDMMRFMIHDNTMDYIALDKEVNYLRNYIDLQRLRVQTSPEISIEDHITYENSEFKIIPMLLIPFVENAFKHGIDLTERSYIRIQLHIENECLNYVVTNSIHKLSSDDYEKENSGIGLKLVEQRLQLAYPRQYQFSYGKKNDDFVCKLSLQLNTIEKTKNAKSNCDR